MKCLTKLTYFLSALYFTATIEPLIHLPYGTILGIQSVTYQNKSYYTFLKIPYAAPPIDGLRFKTPQPPQRWNGTLTCTRLDVACYQMTPSQVEQSEDCLYLNVFTPKLPSCSNVSFPVMFYIHGGGFVDGLSEPYKPDLFINNKVVLVTINYRLGPFGTNKYHFSVFTFIFFLGFLSTQDHLIPGNNGLKDQHFALKWVHNHIGLFGGDPEKVTIFGHSAGSASVGYHLLNPQSKNLFWAAICQSGSVLGPWAYQRCPRKLAFKLASILNSTFATDGSSEDLLKFLQSVDAKQVARAATILNRNTFSNYSEDFASLEGMTWAPVLEIQSDEAFITEKMYVLLKNGRFVKVPLLTGFVTEENLNFHLDLNEVTRTMKAYDDNLINLVPVDMEADFASATKIGHTIRNMYTGGTPFSNHLGDGVRFSSDNDMTRPIMKQAELYSNFSTTYFYVFSFDGIQLGFDYEQFDGAGKVGHGEELDYLFCLASKCDVSSSSYLDQTVRERLVKLWTNFAKFRNPTPEPCVLLENISWPQLLVDQNTFAYLDIGKHLEIKNYPKKETYLKWNQLYHSLGREDFDTY